MKKKPVNSSCCLENMICYEKSCLAWYVLDHADSIFFLISGQTLKRFKIPDHDPCNDK